MKIRGTRSIEGPKVFIDGKELKPDASRKVLDHSPNGFEWSYSGSGPAQLALAILLAAGASPDNAVTYHQAFKNEIIANLKYDFEIEIDIHTDGSLWQVKSIQSPLGLPLTH